MKTNYYNLTGTQREAYKTEIDCIRKNIRALNNQISEISLDTPEIEAEFEIILVKRSALKSALFEFQMMIIDQNQRNARINAARDLSEERGITFEAACGIIEIHPDGAWIGDQA